MPGSQLGLAPMEGVTDFATRMWFFLMAAPDFMWTPFLRITENYPPKKISPIYNPEALVYGKDSPYEVYSQLMASDPLELVRMGRHLLETVTFVDINCGCPAPTVVGHGGGSSILQNLSQLREMIDLLSDELGPQSVSIKTRIGFHSEDEFDSILETFQKAKPVRMVTFHGRTRQEKYQGHSRTHLIEKAALILPYPVLGSGDVVSAQSFNAMKQLGPSLRQFIVGRGALRNPLVFHELRQDSLQAISFKTLKESLGCFYFLQKMTRAAPERLLPFMEKCVLPKKGSVASYEEWAELRRYAQELSGSGKESLVDVEEGRPGIDRLKMLWNYMRSSLPAAFFAPQLLRQRSLGAFFRNLDDIHLSLVDSTRQGDELVLSHNPELDWLYAGGKKNSDQRKR